MLTFSWAGAHARVLMAVATLVVLNLALVIGGAPLPLVGPEAAGSSADRPLPPGFSDDQLALLRAATAMSPKPPGYGARSTSSGTHAVERVRTEAGAPSAPPVVIAEHPEGDAAAMAAHVRAPFEGLSTWVDLYDTGLSPQQQAELSAAAGVDVIFAQASFSSTQIGLHAPERLHALIEAAHDHGLKVMVWTIPDFVDPDVDFKRAQSAISLVTPRGDRPDAFGLDIEMATVEDVAERTRRLIALSGRIRGWVGEGYPMAAIVLPPLQLRLNTRWWPEFPYRAMSEIYDVMIPMSYSSYRGEDAFTTLVWNRDNVTITRQLVGDMSIPVHLAGGIADDLPEVGAFVDAAQASGAIGAGLYDLHTTPPEAWPVLRRLSLRSPAPPPAVLADVPAVIDPGVAVTEVGDPLSFAEAQPTG